MVPLGPRGQPRQVCVTRRGCPCPASSSVCPGGRTFSYFPTRLEVGNNTDVRRHRPVFNGPTVDPDRPNPQMFTFLPLVGIDPGGRKEETLRGRPGAPCPPFHGVATLRPRGRPAVRPRFLGVRVRPSAVAEVGLFPGGHFHFSRFHAKRPRGSAHQISRSSSCVYAGSVRRPLFYLPRVEKW